MIVNTKDFIKALENVRPGLAKREILQQTMDFIFEHSIIRTNNDEVSIMTPFTTNISGCVPADKFYKFLSKLKYDEVEITDKEDSITIRQKKTHATIKKQEVATTTNPVYTLDDKTWKELDETFTNKLKMCIFSASKNNIRPALACIYITNNMMYSCDYYRATKAHLSKSLGCSFLLPASTAALLIRYDPTRFIIDDTWIHFINKNGVIFSSRILDEEYPDLETKLFNIEGTNITLPSTMRNSLDICNPFLDDEFLHELEIEITIGGRRIHYSGVGQIGKIEDENRIVYNGPDITFKVNPAFLLESPHLTKAIIGHQSIKFIDGDIEHVVNLHGDN